MTCITEAHLGRGDADLARTRSEEALADARRSGGRLYEIDAHMSRVGALLRMAEPDRDEAERSLERTSRLVWRRREPDAGSRSSTS